MDPIFEAYRQPSTQVGGSVPVFIGGSNIPVYQGGAGIISDIWRFTKPILTRLVKPASKLALGVASDVILKKKSPKQALKRRALNQLSSLIPTIPVKKKKRPRKRNNKVISVKTRRDIFN